MTRAKITEPEFWSEQHEWLRWLAGLTAADRDTLRRLFGVRLPVPAVCIDATARCATCYRAERETWKVGPYCHRCGSAEELT